MSKSTRFTDEHRFAEGGYVPASKTDIRRTFERVRSRLRRPGEDPLDPQTWAEPHRSKFLNWKPISNKD